MTDFKLFEIQIKFIFLIFICTLSIFLPLPTMAFVCIDSTNNRPLCIDEKTTEAELAYCSHGDGAEISSEATCAEWNTAHPPTVQTTPVDTVGLPQVGDVISGLNTLNRFGSSATPQTVIGRVIKTAMGVVGSLALVMFIYAGFLWMTAAGGAEKTSKAFKVMLWTSMGVILLFSSYAIINFVFGVF